VLVLLNGWPDKSLFGAALAIPVSLERGAELDSICAVAVVAGVVPVQV
jgi:hypothetical protein